MKTWQEPKPNWSLSQLMESKGIFFNFKVVLFPKMIFFSSQLSRMLQDIEKGNHDDEKCEEYCYRYNDWFDQELLDCQFKGNKSKIQNLIRKVHISAMEVWMKSNLKKTKICWQKWKKKLKEIEYFNHSAGCMSLKYLGNVVDYKEQLSL